MFTKGGGGSSNFGGTGDGVASSTIIDGFPHDFAVPGTSSIHMQAANNYNVTEMDEFIGLVGGLSSIGDTVSPFRPQLSNNVAELHRRARNNAILAKLQELESNAVVQAARSERLRMMREEYESLVRKYASSRRAHWGTMSNGHLNENDNNGFPPSRYLQPFNSPRQQSYISSREPVPLLQTTQQLLTTNTHPFTASSVPPTRDFPSNINRSFATTGVNTDITGPIKSIVVCRDDNGDDLQRVSDLKRRKVTMIIDSGSQTEAIEQKENVVLLESSEKLMGPKMESGAVALAIPCGEQPPAPPAALLPTSVGLSSAVPNVYEGRTNQDSIVLERDDERETLLSKQKRNLPAKVEMMLLMLDEEEDESSCQAEERRKQQFENFHQQLEQPKAHLRDDTNSISSAPSTPVMDVGSTSNTTEDVGLKQRHRQKQQLEKVSAEHERKYQKKRNNKNEMKDDTSPDTTTISLATNNKEPNAVKRSVLVGADGLSKKMLLLDDISFSDSTSAFQVHKNQNERNMMLGQIAISSGKKGHINSSTEKSETSRSGQGRDIGAVDGEQQKLPDKNKGDNDEENVIKSEVKQEEDDMQVCSSPTAGATSESIGDSMMDSIQKTPDALLPRDDLELHDHAKINENTQVSRERIELAQNISSDVTRYNSTYDDDDGDDYLVVTATAVPSDMKTSNTSSDGNIKASVRVQSRVNGKESADRKMRPKQSFSSATKDVGVTELEMVHERQINDADEIRADNLSSSKADVPVEGEENFTHANNPCKTITGISNTSASPSQQALPMPSYRKEIMEEQDNRKNAVDVFYEDVEHPIDAELLVHTNIGSKESLFQEKQLVSGDSGRESIRVNELNRKKSTISQSPAPSANMSAHSSTTSSFSSGGSNVIEKGGANGTLFSPSNPTSANIAQRHSSTGSSSTSSTRQHSLDDQVDGSGAVTNSNNILPTKEQSNSGSHHGLPQVKATHQQQSPTLPQSIHKRHEPLQQQMREGKETTPPVGADVTPMLERLSSSSESFSFAKKSVPAVAAAATVSPPTTDNYVHFMNNETKSNFPEKGTSVTKAAKGSPTTSSAPPANSSLASSSPLAKKVSISHATSPNSSGIGIRSGFGSKTSKGSSGSAITIPKGPTGALNTARRVRLKLHEDSDTDSSEIGSGKSQPVSLAKGKATSSSGQISDSIINRNNPTREEKSALESNSSEKKQTELDDDFDDFYDNF